MSHIRSTYQTTFAFLPFSALIKHHVASFSALIRLVIFVILNILLENPKSVTHSKWRAIVEFEKAK